MTVMEPGSEILKVDEVGRIQTPPEKREALLAEYDRSGMTGAQFARFSGVICDVDVLAAEAAQGNWPGPASDNSRPGSAALAGSARGGRSPKV